MQNAMSALPPKRPFLVPHEMYALSAYRALVLLPQTRFTRSLVCDREHARRHDEPTPGGRQVDGRAKSDGVPSEVTGFSALRTRAGYKFERYETGGVAARTRRPSTKQAFFDRIQPDGQGATASARESLSNRPHSQWRQGPGRLGL